MHKLKIKGITDKSMLLVKFCLTESTPKPIIYYDV